MAPKFGSTNSISNWSEIWIEIQISLQFCVTLQCSDLIWSCVCIFWTLIIWEIILQSSNLIWGINFVPLLSLSLHSSSPTFKLLSMASYGGELVLDSSSPWSGVSNHHSSFSILLPLIFKKQRTLLMKKIQGLQALHGATSYGATT